VIGGIGMRRIIAARQTITIVVLSVLLGLRMYSDLSAGSYTLNTSVGQDTAIARLRAFSNTSNLFGAPFADDLTFVRAMCTQGIQRVQDAAKAANPTWDSAVANATPAQKDAACVAIGAAAGCLP